MERTAFFVKMLALVRPSVVMDQALVDLLNHARKDEFAISGVNIVGANLIDAYIEAAKKPGSLIIVTFACGRRSVHCQEGC
jgi:fructose/tagatose bisphosphate aldolase